MSKDQSPANAGLSVITLLGIAFVVLKLCKVITWSWWWVTLPFWGGIAVAFIAILIVLTSTGLKLLFSNPARRK